MLDPFVTAYDTNKMNFDPLISGIELRNDMRDALRALSCQNPLGGAAMPGLLRRTQIDLDIIEQAACAIRDAGCLCVRDFRRIRLVIDPIRQRRAMDELLS